MAGPESSRNRAFLAVERLRAYVGRLPYVGEVFDDEYCRILAMELYEDIAADVETAEPRAGEELDDRIRRLVGALRRQAPAIQSVLDGIVGLVDSSGLRVDLPKDYAESGGWTRHPGIRKSIDRIRKDFGQALSTQKLAQAACLGKSQFMAVFRSETGLTPHEFLRRVRIDAALRLLKLGKGVTETCFEVGFTSLGGFKSAFSDLVGMLPSEYQKKQPRACP